MENIRVLIVDEHLAVRQALSARLASCPRIQVVATACHFREGLEWARLMRPDVVLLELKGKKSPDEDPVGDFRLALADHHGGIIVLTSYADDDEREAALQGGANRYLLKQIDTSRLLAEIEAVAAESGELVS
jgi:two-component system nitrate/nitrite response regulator NarL